MWQPGADPWAKMMPSSKPVQTPAPTSAPSNATSPRACSLEFSKVVLAGLAEAGASRQVIAGASAALWRLHLQVDTTLKPAESIIHTFDGTMMAAQDLLGSGTGVSAVKAALHKFDRRDLAKRVEKQHCAHNASAHSDPALAKEVAAVLAHTASTCSASDSVDDGIAMLPHGSACEILLHDAPAHSTDISLHNPLAPVQTPSASQVAAEEVVSEPSVVILELAKFLEDIVVPKPVPVQEIVVPVPVPQLQVVPVPRVIPREVVGDVPEPQIQTAEKIELVKTVFPVQLQVIQVETETTLTQEVALEVPGGGDGSATSACHQTSAASALSGAGKAIPKVEIFEREVVVPVARQLREEVAVEVTEIINTEVLKEAAIAPTVVVASMRKSN